MKINKTKLILISILLLSLTLFIIDYNHKYNLVIKVTQVDEKSPDRILTVYDNDKEIKFKEILYTDNTYLCNYKTPVVNYFDIKNETELVVKVKYNRKIKAKLVFN